MNKYKIFYKILSFDLQIGEQFYFNIFMFQHCKFYFIFHKCGRSIFRN